MADTKYGKFVLGSILKLAVFIVLCAGAYIASRFLGSPADKLLPSVMAVIFTFIFLAAVEGGKRSFFSKGDRHIWTVLLCAFRAGGDAYHRHNIGL